MPLQGESIAAHVPGTVLSNLIANNIYPDPNVGLRHRSIPDIYHVGRDFYTCCFTTSFLRPAAWDPVAGCRALLTLHGINYAARCIGAHHRLCLSSKTFLAKQAHRRLRHVPVDRQIRHYVIT